jgi:hypothetical protein
VLRTGFTTDTSPLWFGSDSPKRSIFDAGIEGERQIGVVVKLLKDGRFGRQCWLGAKGREFAVSVRKGEKSGFILA